MRKKTLSSIGIDEFFVKPMRKMKKDAIKKGNIMQTMYYQILENIWKNEREQAKSR